MHKEMTRNYRLWSMICAWMSLSVVSAQNCQVEADGASNCAPSDNPMEQRSTKIRLGLEWFINPDHLPFIVAQEHGIFAQFDLDVELVEPTDHWEADEEIQKGTLDIAVTEPIHLAQDAARGKPVIGFTRFLHTDGGVMYQRNSGITSPRDMCGKTIAYPGSPGPGGPAIVHTMVKHDGGGEDCDPSLYGKYNGGFFHTDALASGNADVATLIFWNFEIPEAKARGLDVAFFSLKDYGVPDFCQLVLMTTPSRFQELRPALQRLTLALRRATGLIHQHPALAKKYYVQYISAVDSGTDQGQQESHAANADAFDKDSSFSMLDSIFAATLPAFPNDYTMSTEYYDNLMQWLIDTDQVDADAGVAAKTNVSNYWTNEIAL